MVVVFFAAGCLEIVSILFRPVSLSFRLYGNVFAGENMLEAMATMVPGLGLAAADPLLLHGTAGRAGAGAGVHAADGGLHAAHLSARRGGAGHARTGESPAACRRRAAGARTKERTTTNDWQLARRPGSARHGDRCRVDRHGRVDRRRAGTPARPRRSWSSRFWPSPSRRRWCSTRCSWCSNVGESTTSQ